MMWYKSTGNALVEHDSLLRSSAPGTLVYWYFPWKRVGLASSEPCRAVYNGYEVLMTGSDGTWTAEILIIWLNLVRPRRTMFIVHAYDDAI